jgi:hypothetical protein
MVEVTSMSDAVKMAKRTPKKVIRYCYSSLCKICLKTMKTEGNQFKQAVQNL